MSIETTTLATEPRSARVRNARPGRRRLRLALAFVAALVSIGGQLASAGAAVGATTSTGSDTLVQRTRHPLVAVGSGEVTGELPFCLNGLAGPCGWAVEGKITGTPIRSGTFAAVIDHGQALSSRRCVDAFYTGVVRASATDEIANTARGKLCPDGADGYVFAGRVEVGAGFGRFADISSGHGRMLLTLPARNAATLTLAGSFRTG